MLLISCRDSGASGNLTIRPLVSRLSVLKSLLAHQEDEVAVQEHPITRVAYRCDFCKQVTIRKETENAPSHCPHCKNGSVSLDVDYKP